MRLRKLFAGWTDAPEAFTGLMSELSEVTTRISCGARLRPAQPYSNRRLPAWVLPFSCFVGAPNRLPTTALRRQHPDHRLRPPRSRRLKRCSYGHLRIDRLAADLDEVLTALNVTAPLTLVGHSMGAMAALAYLSRPARERSVDPHGLVLVAAAAGKLAQRGLGRLLGTRAWHRVGRYSWCERWPQHLCQPPLDSCRRYVTTTCTGPWARCARRRSLSAAVLIDAPHVIDHAIRQAMTIHANTYAAEVAQAGRGNDVQRTVAR